MLSQCIDLTNITEAVKTIKKVSSCEGILGNEINKFKIFLNALKYFYNLQIL